MWAKLKYEGRDERITHCLPRQLLGPTRNGSYASLLSFANLDSPSGSQRSGWNESEDVKWVGLLCIVFPGTPIRDFEVHCVNMDQYRL